MKTKDLLLVILQVFLFIVYFMSPSGSRLPYISGVLDLIIAAIGLALVFIALLQLNRSLTPFPTPLTNGTLITNGVYKLIRHPIYTGIICITLGMALYTASNSRLLITLLLLFLFMYKSGYEEEMLLLKYPEYKQYKLQTGRFLPMIIKKK